MKFTSTGIIGCFLIELELLGDDRGYFARTFCAREFAEHGLNSGLAQASISYSRERGTLRGLHFQQYPAMEDKLVRCLKGAIFDVMVDIRPGSPTYGKWFAAELSEANNMQLFGAAGLAHGFQTLTDDVVLSYHIAQFYESDKAAGIRWDDPDIGIDWPLPPVNQSPRDLILPSLADVDPGVLQSFRVTVA